MSGLFLPIPGRFRNSRNHVLSPEAAHRPELAQLKPTTLTGKAALLLVSHRFVDLKGKPYDAVIDARGFALLLKLARREKLIVYGPHGHPIGAKRFLRELQPFMPYFARGKEAPLRLFLEGIAFWRDQARRRPVDVFLEALPRHPHEFV